MTQQSTNEQEWWEEDFDNLYKPYCVMDSLCTDSQIRDKQKVKSFIFNVASKEYERGKTEERRRVLEEIFEVIEQKLKSS